MDEISLEMLAVTLWETFGWGAVASVIVVALSLIVLWRSMRRARRRNLGAFKLFMRGLVVMLIVAVILTPFIPVWTLAPVGGLHGWIDYLSAFGMALAPAALVGIVWVYFGSLRTASRPARR